MRRRGIQGDFAALVAAWSVRRPRRLVPATLEALGHLGDGEGRDGQSQKRSLTEHCVCELVLAVDWGMGIREADAVRRMAGEANDIYTSQPCVTRLLFFRGSNGIVVKLVSTHIWCCNLGFRLMFPEWLKWR